MIKKHSFKLAAGISLGLACCSQMMGQSSDALLDKLVEKGILSVKEANTLREESDKDFNKAYSMKSGMPDWVSSLKINGDFRGRFDHIAIDNGPTLPKVQDRDRFRYRARLGVTASMYEDFEVGVRLSSGEAYGTTPAFGGSPFSGNTTLNNDGSRKFVFLDLAYVRYTPAKWADVQIGKMVNQFWVSPMVMSPDYDPEGAQEKFTLPINDKQSINLTAGQWVLNENNPGRDVYFLGEQLDWTAKWTPKISSRLGVMTYTFANQSAMASSIETFAGSFNNGTPLSGTAAQPNGLTYGAQDFTPVIGRAELTYALESFPIFKGEFPITFAAEYAVNPDADGHITLANGTKTPQPYGGKQNEAYNLGVTFGSSKLKHNWQIGYTYKNIETASLWRGLMDDNFGYNGRGGADVRGHLVAASWRMATPLLAQVQYFNTQPINRTHETHQDRFLVDLMWSF